MTPGLRYATVPAVSVLSTSAPLVMAFAADVQLQLRHDPGVGLVARSEAHGAHVAVPEVLTGLVELLSYRRLQLTVDEGVEILTERLIPKRRDDRVSGTGRVFYHGWHRQDWRPASEPELRRAANLARLGRADGNRVPRRVEVVVTEIGCEQESFAYIIRGKAGHFRSNACHAGKESGNKKRRLSWERSSLCRPPFLPLCS